MARLLPERLARFIRTEDGWVTPLSLIIVIGVFSVGGVAVEHLNVIHRKATMRTAADAVALAAASALPDEDAALERGLAMAALYYGEDSQTIITEDDIEFGSWDRESLSFSTDSDDPDSVQVTASMIQSRGNALQTVFTRMTGTDTIDVRARSIAQSRATATERCQSGGLFSEGWTTANSNNDFTSGFCLYGGQGVDLGSNNSFSSGSGLVLAPFATLTQGNGNSGLSAAQAEAELELELPDAALDIIGDLQAGDTTALFNGDLYTVRSVSSIDKKDTLIENSLYIVSGTVELAGNTDYENIAIVATGNISMASNTTAQNFVLASAGSISTNSNTIFGTDGYCDGGRYQSYLFAAGNISFNSNNELLGVQMAARGSISMNSNISAMDDVHAEALGDISFNSNNSLNNCDTALTSDFDLQPEETLGNGTRVVGLVY